MNFVYPVTLTPDPDGGFVVTFPDWPEAITQGETRDQALEEAADCLEAFGRADSAMVVSAQALAAYTSRSNTRRAMGLLLFVMGLLTIAMPLGGSIAAGHSH